MREVERLLGEASVSAEGLLNDAPEDARELPLELQGRAREVAALYGAALVRLIHLARDSAMLAPVDVTAVQLSMRRIEAALRLRAYEEWGPELLHDEDVVLGVRPAGYAEDRWLSPPSALNEIRDAADQAARRVGVLLAEAEAEAQGQLPLRADAAVAVQPGTAFIIMAIDPAMEDAKRAIQEEFARFGIRAVRADDIEHSEEITHRILDAIRTSEFLIADLTAERPSVYYEIGFAHAIGKRPFLYRRAGTPLHFDLAVHNCPEYRNIVELRERVHRRLNAVTGRDQ